MKPKMPQINIILSNDIFTPIVVLGQNQGGIMLAYQAEMGIDDRVSL